MQAGGSTGRLQTGLWDVEALVRTRRPTGFDEFNFAAKELSTYLKASASRAPDGNPKKKKKDAITNKVQHHC